MGDAILFFGLIFITVAIGLAVLKALIEALGHFLAFIAPGVVLFLLSSIFFGFSAEAATAQGITSSVALGVMKSKMLGM